MENLAQSPQKSPLPGTTKAKPRKRGHAKRAEFRKQGHEKRAGFRKKGHPKSAGFKMKNGLLLMAF